MNEIAPAPHAAVLQLLTGHFHQTSGYRILRPDGVGDWLLVLTLSGSGRFGHAGGELVTMTGDWVLIRPGVPHDYSVATGAENWELLWAHFQPRAAWLDWLGWPEVARGLMRLRIEEPAVAAGFAEVDRLLHGEWRRREGFAMNMLERVLLDCDRHNPKAASSRYDARVRRALDFLDRKLGAKISVDDVAAAAGLSASRLAHLFRAETGQTPQRYLEAARMQRAIELLERTGFPIQQIAGAVGFDSPFYFSQRFKRWTGLSPAAYRAAMGRQRRGEEATVIPPGAHR